MKRVKSVVKGPLALVSLLAGVSLLVPVCLMAQSGVPNIVEPTPFQTPLQQESHFLTFIGSFVQETTTTARAYYKAIDPQGKKQTFTKWLVNAGFISDESQWNPYGPQQLTRIPGDYGHAKINADSHVIALNDGDLGFVRNQYIRCVPNCAAPNPISYSYLENYPVAPFAQNGSNFGSVGGSSFPTQAEAARAIQSANNRPLGEINGDGKSACQDAKKCIERIADVAFEWAPAPGSFPSSTTRYGQLYAYIFHHTNPNVITETINWPNDPGFLAKLNARTDNQFPALPPSFPQGIQATDPFAPELDGLGFKQHLGVCFICHGGTPQNLTSTGKYPRAGEVDGFRLLPLDITNLLFTSDGGPEATSRINQEADMKRYNQAVLLTVPTQLERDNQGVLRLPHLAEVIRGWYTDPGQPPMSRTTQNTNFIPVGWRGSRALEDFYLTTVAPSCRSCHFNRELSLDFGTVQNFDQESDLLQLVLLPECETHNPDPNKRPMPLARLTFQRLWEAQAIPQTLPSGVLLSNTVDKIKSHFGFNTPTAYCQSNP